MHPSKVGWTPRVRVLTRIVLATITIPFATASALAGVNAGIGADSPINGDRASVLTLSYVTDQRFPWEFGIGRFSAHNSPTTDQPTPVTYYFGVSRRLTWRHLFASGGLVYDTANDRTLSGHYQIQTALGLTYGACTLSVRHISNASTTGTNHGETFALFEYGF